MAKFIFDDGPVLDYIRDSKHINMFNSSFAKKKEFLQALPDWSRTGTSYKNIVLSSMNQSMNFFRSDSQIRPKSIENERRIQRLVNSTAKLFITNWLHVVFVLSSLYI